MSLDGLLLSKGSSEGNWISWKGKMTDLGGLQLGCNICDKDKKSKKLTWNIHLISKVILLIYHDENKQVLSLSQKTCSVLSFQLITQ